MSSPSTDATFFIAPEGSKSLNPNRRFAASYDQTVYEKTIPPLYVLSWDLWQLVSAGSD
jgi:hypothetical protein